MSVRERSERPAAGGRNTRRILELWGEGIGAGGGAERGRGLGTGERCLGAGQ
eukprot:COSAG02_NODE_4823_length_4937_cov_4.146341_7_plen_52_part_00